MTEKEFKSLSEKIFIAKKVPQPNKKGYFADYYSIKVGDVKEFIKRLKEDEDSYDLQSAEAIQFRNAIQNKRDKLLGNKF